ncbi:integrase core domain protein [Burkholderia pseudomallei MSHR4000]|nr:integrase core domain protein [Burkholderia pseudomallei MSHR4000]
MPRVPRIACQLSRDRRGAADLPPTNRASRSLVKFVFGEEDEHEEALYGTANHRVSNGRRVKCLTVVDDFTKEAVDIVVDHGISGLYVARALDRAARFRGYPKAVRTDQGPEFTSRALDQWAYANGVTLKLIQAGKPTQNAYIESFNGKFRDECLNEHWFTTLAHARAVIAAWRQDYNEQRPHSALNYLAPSEFAAKHRATADAPAAFQEWV